MGEFGLSGRRYLRKGPIKRTHHVHIYQFDNTQEILRHLAFRNYLRENPSIDYNLWYIKKETIGPSTPPIALINIWMAKDAFIKKIEKEALKKYWKNKKRLTKASNFFSSFEKMIKSHHLKNT